MAKKFNFPNHGAGSLHQLSICPLGDIHYYGHSTTREFRVENCNHVNDVSVNINCDTEKVIVECASIAILTWLGRSGFFQSVRDLFYR